jgi:hypothetical protein
LLLQSRCVDFRGNHSGAACGMSCVRLHKHLAQPRSPDIRCIVNIFRVYQEKGKLPSGCRPVLQHILNRSMPGRCRHALIRCNRFDLTNPVDLILSDVVSDSRQHSRERYRLNLFSNTSAIGSVAGAGCGRRTSRRTVAKSPGSVTIILTPSMTGSIMPCPEG